MPRNPTWNRDELLLALDAYLHVGLPASHEHPEILKLSERLRGLTDLSVAPDGAIYRNPNGVYLKLANFRSIDPSSDAKGMSHGGAGDQLVWDEWAHRPEELRKVAGAITTVVADAAGSPSLIDDDAEAPEGRILLGLHRRRERSSRLSRLKKAAARKAGALVCEACGFDPATFYPGLRDAAIECHHLVPLAELSTEATTRQADLALLCANCHRTIHSEGVSIKELRGRAVAVSQ